MDRRSLLAGAFTLLIGNTALRAKEVQLPELAVTQTRIPFKPLPDYGPHVKDRRYLKDLWRAARDLKAEKNYIPTNAEVKAGIDQYLNALDAKFPVTFIGWDTDSHGEDRLIEVTLHGYREKKRGDGCAELEMIVSIPHLNKQERAFTNLLNIDCRRA